MSIGAARPEAKADRYTLAAFVWAHVATWAVLFVALLGVAVWALSQDDDRVFPGGGVGAMFFGTAAMFAAAVATVFVVPAVLLGTERSIDQLRAVSTLTCLFAVVTSVPVGAWCAFAAVRSIGPAEALFFAATAALLFTLVTATLTLVARIYRFAPDPSAS